MSAIIGLKGCLRGLLIIGLGFLISLGLETFQICLLLGLKGGDNLQSRFGFLRCEASTGTGFGSLVFGAALFESLF